MVFREDLGEGCGGPGEEHFTSSCGWRCKEARGGEEEETESTWRLIQCGSKNKGGIAGALSRENGCPEGGVSGSVVRVLQGETHSVLMSVFASLTDQVREKKDVPLGPEDPKEEDGSFDYRWVVSLAPVGTQCPQSGGCPRCPEQGPALSSWRG